MDGKTFIINGESVKAEAGTHGNSWHHLIGLQDIVANDRRDVLLMPEGSKDGLAALHFADAEGSLRSVGIAVGLCSGLKVLDSDTEKLRSRRVRIFGDADSAGDSAATRIGERLVTVVTEVQIFNLSGLKRDDGAPVKDLYDLTRIDYDQFEANRDLWSVTDLDSKGERVKTIPTRFCFSASPKIIPSKKEFFLSPFSPPPCVS